MNYAPATDRKGRDLRPGDKVRFKLYPRGSGEGVVVISKRTQVVMPDGSALPALSIDVDGTLFGMPPPKGVLKIGSAFTPMPPDLQSWLDDKARHSRVASAPFVSQVCDSPWDRFIEEWAARSYVFVGQALGPYQKEPLRTILPLDDAMHAAGANASFEPATGQIRLHPTVVDGKPGTTLEKLTHELIHASLNDFPEGDPFHEEGVVDYSTWVLAHSKVWGQYRGAMVDAAQYNLDSRKERALRTQTDYDAKRWMGGVYATQAFGPHIIFRLRQKKLDGDLTW